MASQKNENPQQLKARAAVIVRRLRKQFPNPKTALHFSNPLQLLIGTILSAQCTDKQVNIVTKDLFKKYKTVEDYARAKQPELEQDVRSTGFYKHKAKNIIACCRMLIEQHGGKVPKTMEELIQLPGVGRKTANCVLGAAYNINEGVVVDTHVLRLSQRLGLTRNETPEKIEQDLMQIIPRPDWYDFANLLIEHGREVCNARKPNCPACSLKESCPSAEKLIMKFWRE
ncbi:MAG: endonuclease III [Ignavibacteriae bacterium]|nr:endonuclease III [Ignavibacteriota bacterium]